MTRTNLAIAEPVMLAHSAWVEAHSPWAIPGLLERLKELNLEGQSAGQIDHALNHEFRGQLLKPITRNAVIGKIHRLGLAVGSGKSGGLRSQKRKPPAVIRKGKLRVRKGGRLENVEIFQVAPIETVEDFQTPVEQRRMIHELESTHCCWPIGDPQDHDGFFYCGADKINGMSYCAGHCRIAYRGAPARSSFVARGKKGRITMDFSS